MFVSFWIILKINHSTYCTHLPKVLSSITIVGLGFILLFVRRSNGTELWLGIIFGVPWVIEPKI